MADALITRRVGGYGDLQYIEGSQNGNGSQTTYSVTFPQSINPKKIQSIIIYYEYTYLTIHGGYSEDYERMLYPRGGSNYWSTVTSVTETQMTVDMNVTRDGYSHPFYYCILYK